MKRSITLMLALALAGTAVARDAAPARPLGEADRDMLTRIVVDTWAAHVEPEQKQRWLDSVRQKAASVPLPWLESATAAIDLRTVDLALQGLAPLDGVAPTAFGSAGGNLVFTALEPCRLLDTRQPSERGGVLPDNSERSFFGFGTSFSAEQGGSSTNCGLTLEAQPEALAINLVAVNPSGDGFLTAYPTGSGRPLAASLNYMAGTVTSTGMIMPINNNLEVDDFTIYSWSSTHVVADVVGYFARPQAAPLSCTTQTSASVSIAAGGNSYVSTAGCAEGETAMFGACMSDSVNAVLVISEVLETGGQTGCWFRNTGASSINVQAQGRCCTVPGR